MKETVSELQKNNLVVCELTEQVNALRYVWRRGGVGVGVEVGGYMKVGGGGCMFE